MDYGLTIISVAVSGFVSVVKFSSSTLGSEKKESDLQKAARAEKINELLAVTVRANVSYTRDASLFKPLSVPPYSIYCFLVER